MLLPPVAEDPTLPPDRSVLPPPPPLLAPPPKLLLLLLLLEKEPVMLPPPPPRPPTVLLFPLLTLALLPPLSDDVIDAAELLAVEALELDDLEDERLPLSVPTWYSWLARFSTLLVVVEVLLLLLLVMPALFSLFFPPPPPPPPSLPTSQPSLVADVVEPPIEPYLPCQSLERERERESVRH